MKNFKINAITALVVGLNVATAHAARTTNPEPNQNVLYSGGSVFLNHADATNVDEPSHTAIGQSNLIYSVPESNDPTEDQGSSSAFGNQNTIKGQHANAFGDGKMHMVNKLKALETAIKFMQMIYWIWHQESNWYTTV